MKIRTIEKFATQTDKVLGLTGYSSTSDLCEEMFILLAILELQIHTYAETDAYFSK